MFGGCKAGQQGPDIEQDLYQHREQVARGRPRRAITVGRLGPGHTIERKVHGGWLPVYRQGTTLHGEIEVCSSCRNCSSPPQ
eukprot:3593152-Amphidinium_carterae.1